MSSGGGEAAPNAIPTNAKAAQPISALWER